MSVCIFAYRNDQNPIYPFTNLLNQSNQSRKSIIPNKLLKLPFKIVNCLNTFGNSSIMKDYNWLFKMNENFRKLKI
jgi:hypothetical protein